MNNTTNSSFPESSVDRLPVIHYAMLWAMFSLSFPGLFLNLLVCFLTFHPAVSGDYKWFIFNLSAIDTVYSISNFFHSHFMLFQNDYDGIFCKISAILHWYCVLVSLFALLPISFNRLCSLRYHNMYNRISTPLGIGLMLFVCDFSPLLMILPYPLIFSDIIRYTYSVYSCDFDTPATLGGMLYSGGLLLETPLMFGVLVYVNWRILQIVRSRKKASGIDHSGKLRLKETNSLMRATILQAVVPMVVQVPLLTTTMCFIIGANVPVQWDTFSVVVHSINPIADSLITFLIVKTYNRALRMNFSKLAPKLKPSSNTNASTAVMSMAALENQEKRASLNSVIVAHR